MKRLVCIAITLIGCKDDASKASPTASASVAPSVSASASASASATPSGPSTFGGSYQATTGTLYVPDAAMWDGVKFRGDDGGAGALGDGTLTITIDADGGALSGQLEGPLGPADLSGFVMDKSVTFHVAAREKSDLAFSGTGTGTVDGNKISGDIHVSSWRANVLRDATFELKRK